MSHTVFAVSKPRLNDVNIGSNYKLGLPDFQYAALGDKVFADIRDLLLPLDSKYTHVFRRNIS